MPKGYFVHFKSAQQNIRSLTMERNINFNKKVSLRLDFQPFTVDFIQGGRVKCTRSAVLYEIYVSL